MSRKNPKQPVARKPAKTIADPRRVRYGSGFAPASIVHSQNLAASLKK